MYQYIFNAGDSVWSHSLVSFRGFNGYFLGCANGYYLSRAHCLPMCKLISANFWTFGYHFWVLVFDYPVRSQFSQSSSSLIVKKALFLEFACFGWTVQIYVFSFTKHKIGHVLDFGYLLARRPEKQEQKIT